MKSPCLIILLALSISGCSMLTKSGRDRAYYNKQLKEAKAAREKRHKQIIQHQRAAMPSLRNTPPPLEQNVQPPPENQ
jgi:hypothetical protein